MDADTSKKLRILHVDSLLTGGGTDQLCVKLAHALRECGHEVWMAGPEKSPFAPALAQAGILFHPAPRQKKLSFIYNLARGIRRIKPQIVHAHHGRDYWLTVLATLFSGQHPKIVLSRHLAKSPGSWISRRMLLTQCDAMVAVSDFVARVLREGVYEPDSPQLERRSRGPMSGDLTKIVVAHGGIDTKVFCPHEGGSPNAAANLRQEWKLEPQHYVFAVAGAYDKPNGKGQREFLLAASRIHQTVPDARFLIIGRGSLAETLKSDISNLGLGGKAWLTPYCSNMPLVMNAIDCLVHPAVGTEALGLVLCESLACGRPAIASELDGIPEALVAPDLGTLVPPGSVEALEKAMLHWAQQSRWDFAKRQQVHAQVDARFSLRAAAERLEGIYFKLLER